MTAPTRSARLIVNVHKPGELSTERVLRRAKLPYTSERGLISEAARLVGATPFHLDLYAMSPWPPLPDLPSSLVVSFIATPRQVHIDLEFDDLMRWVPYLAARKAKFTAFMSLNISGTGEGEALVVPPWFSPRSRPSPRCATHRPADWCH